jgi:hypothetical protein
MDQSEPEFITPEGRSSVPARKGITMKITHVIQRFVPALCALAASAAATCTFRANSMQQVALALLRAPGPDRMESSNVMVL